MAYITSTTPKKYKLYLYRLLNYLLGPIGRRMIQRKFHHIFMTGVEHFQGGPKLVLMNHSCPLDPVLLTLFSRQPLQFLITEAFMQGSLLSKIGSILGQITKRKLDIDPQSIQLMKKWSQLGAHVALFPEGQFSWDGKPSPLMPGLEQLIHYLKLPVLCVHLANGSRVKPAWATNMRKTSIAITIYPELKLENEKNILEAIAQRIFPEQEITFPVEGSNLAHGLAKAIRYCPQCAQEHSLSDVGNILSCSTCGERYEINANNDIINKSITSVRDLIQRTYSYLDQLPVIHSINKVSLYDVTKKEWSFITENYLSISVQGLALGDFNLAKDEILNHALDWGEVIIIKTRKNRYALKFTEDSRLIFDYALKKVRHD